MGRGGGTASRKPQSKEQYVCCVCKFTRFIGIRVNLHLVHFVFSHSFLHGMFSSFDFISFAFTISCVCMCSVVVFLRIAIIYTCAQIYSSLSMSVLHERLYSRWIDLLAKPLRRRILTKPVELRSLPAGSSAAC